MVINRNRKSALRISSVMFKGFRYAWPAVYTVIGLTFLAVPWRGERKLVRYRGTLGVVGPAVERLLKHAMVPGGAAAMTLGHTILAVDEAAFYGTWTHEIVHVRQYERWGVLFVPAYLISSIWIKARGGDAYWDNPFEVQARAEDINAQGQC
jgi:hypothetical protein